MEYDKLNNIITDFNKLLDEQERRQTELNNLNGEITTLKDKLMEFKQFLTTSENELKDVT